MINKVLYRIYFFVAILTSAINGAALNKESVSGNDRMLHICLQY